jgi:hypothetical protein
LKYKGRGLINADKKTVIDHAVDLINSMPKSSTWDDIMHEVHYENIIE